MLSIEISWNSDFPQGIQQNLQELMGKRIDLHQSQSMPCGSQSNAPQESINALQESIKCPTRVNQMPCGSQSNAPQESTYSISIKIIG